MSTVELFQFDFSHFNEKVRWALDFKRIPHVRHSLLPGPHMLPIKRLTGQTTVPVLRIGERVISGSSQIISYLEERQPAPPLFPADPVECRRALELQAWFDDQVGPAIRRAFFFEFLNDGGYAARTFAGGHGTLSRLVYRGLFPGIRLVMRKNMQIDADGAARGRARTQEALDLVARAGGGYLVGDRFSVADLTAASLLSPVVFPPELHARPPEPRARVLTDWLARWAGHPGTAWVVDISRRHRSPSAAVAASSQGAESVAAP